MENQKTYRTSKQRQRILEVLKSSKEHPTADWIYERVKDTFPAISLGTIYRNLGVLQEQGLVRRLNDGGGADRYDADMYGHSHFYCHSCGSVYDVYNDGGIPSGYRFKDGHRVESQTTSYHGTCGICLENSQ